jgi:hypothetical protein
MAGEGFAREIQNSRDYRPFKIHRVTKQIEQFADE